MLLRSPLVPDAPLVHGFSTRLGGVSSGPYRSFNLGQAWGDSEAQVQANFERLAAEGGFAREELVMVKQVHGNRVLRASELEEGAQADGLYASASDPGPKVLAVRTADCVPILLCSSRGDRFAALHSGWRGTVANIVAPAVQALTRELTPHIEASDLWAMVGPCIELDAFEVGDEVAEHFPVEQRRRDAWGRWHVDLPGTVGAQLREAGLHPERCLRVGQCTHAHPDLYFSYRRDGRPTGQMLSFIGLPQAG